MGISNMDIKKDVLKLGEDIVIHARIKARLERKRHWKVKTGT